MNRMFPIAFIVSQQQMRRSLVGAAATDPGVPARSRHVRRATKAQPASRLSADRSRSSYSCGGEKTRTA